MSRDAGEAPGPPAVSDAGGLRPARIAPRERRDPGGGYASSEEEAYLAYQAPASAVSQELGPYLGTYVAEYLASVAVHHYSMWKDGPDSPNTQLPWTTVLNNHQRVVVNGRYDVD